MADLNPLIRVRRHAVEQKQKFLAALYRQADELEAQKAVLLEQLEAERDKTTDMDVEFLKYFAPYEQAVRERVADIDEDRAKLETRIVKARDDMREAFADLKKIEITQDRRAEEALAEINKKEADALDDMGIEGFRRRGDEG